LISKKEIKKENIDNAKGSKWLKKGHEVLTQTNLPHIFGLQYLQQWRNITISLVCFTIWKPFTKNHERLVVHMINWMDSQLLEGFKSESKYKTAEGGEVKARSLALNTLRGRGACWSSGMGLGRVDKLHSLTRASTQPTQGG
jgi:hypothetical protein